MKELRDLIDAELDRAFYGPGRHFVNEFIGRRMFVIVIALLSPLTL